MQEMLDYIVKNLVSNPDAVEIAIDQQGHTTVYKVLVDDKDIGSVIGRGGAIANAIRTVVKSASTGKARMVIKFESK